MAAYFYLPLCCFIFLQVAWGMPASGSDAAVVPSYGAQFQTDFNKNLAAVMNNLHNGATTLAQPGIKLTVDTIPNLIHQGVTTATDSINKISAASKEGMQKIGVGVGQAVGGGGVMGSAMAGGAMQVAGHGLGVGVDVANAGAKAAMDLLGHVGSNTASGISVGTTIGADALSTLGNGMMVAGTGFSVGSKILSDLMDYIGKNLTNSINKAEQVIAMLMDAGMMKMENGALKFSTSAQANVYNILNSFLQILVNVQKLFDSFRMNINAGITTGGAVNTTTSGTTEGQASTPTAKSSRDLHSLKVNLNGGVASPNAANPTNLGIIGRILNAASGVTAKVRKNHPSVRVNLKGGVTTPSASGAVNIGPIGGVLNAASGNTEGQGNTPTAESSKNLHNLRVNLKGGVSTPSAIGAANVGTIGGVLNAASENTEEKINRLSDESIRGLDNMRASLSDGFQTPNAGGAANMGTIGGVFNAASGNTKEEVNRPFDESIRDLDSMRANLSDDVKLSSAAGAANMGTIDRVLNAAGGNGVGETNTPSDDFTRRLDSIRPKLSDSVTTPSVIGAANMGTIDGVLNAEGGTTEGQNNTPDESIRNLQHSINVNLNGGISPPSAVGATKMGTIGEVLSAASGNNNGYTSTPNTKSSFGVNLNGGVTIPSAAGAANMGIISGVLNAASGNTEGYTSTPTAKSSNLHSFGGNLNGGLMIPSVAGVANIGTSGGILNAVNGIVGESSRNLHSLRANLNGGVTIPSAAGIANMGITDGTLNADSGNAAESSRNLHSLRANLNGGVTIPSAAGVANTGIIGGTLNAASGNAAESSRNLHSLRVNLNSGVTSPSLNGAAKRGTIGGILNAGSGANIGQTSTPALKSGWYLRKPKIGEVQTEDVNSTLQSEKEVFSAQTV